MLKKGKKIIGLVLLLLWAVQLLSACGTLTSTEVVPAVVATPATTMGTIITSNTTTSATDIAGQVTVLHVAVDPRVANSMSELVANSTIIVIGQVSSADEIWNYNRDANNPNQADSNELEVGQVYNLNVQRYLKGSGDNSIKFVQSEGLIKTNQATASPANISEAKLYYPHVSFEAGVKYLFFLSPLGLGSPGKNYFSTTIHPWVFTVPDNGKAEPQSAKSEVASTFPAKATADFLQEVQQVIAQNPTLADVNAAPSPTLIPNTTPPTNITNAPRANGIPAIKPHLNANVAGGANTASTPTYAEADVRTYIAQEHPEWGLIKPLGAIVVDKVEFLANKDVDGRLGKKTISALTGITPDGLVCLVTGHGKFANRGANGMPGTPSSTQNQSNTPALTFAQAYWVFDITTGNLLMMGGYGS
jgi:hypothetical protein